MSSNIRTALKYCLVLLTLCILPARAENLATTSPDSLSLSECYRAALTTSEGIQRTEIDVQIAEEQYKQAVALLYPSILFSSTQRLRGNSQFGSLSRTSSTGDDTFDNTSSTSSSSRLGRNQIEGLFTVRQPLFNGFRDFFIKGALKAGQSALALERDRAREALYLDVADLYFQVRMYSAELLLLNETESTLRSRVEELVKFITLGKSKESEQLAAEADLSQLRASREQAQGLLNASQELLAFLINRPADSFSLVAKQADVPQVTPLDQYILRGKLRADLKASEQRVTAAELQAKAAQRARWPSLDLEANGYAFEDPDRNRDWELALRLEIPLYEGGALESRIAEEKLKESRARLVFGEHQRSVERDIRIAYSNLTAANKQLEKLRRAADAAQRSYVSQKDDYTLGRVTNLEVLQAIRQSLEARRAVLEAETTVSRNRVNLEVTAGGVNQ